VVLSLNLRDRNKVTSSCNTHEAGIIESINDEWGSGLRGAFKIGLMVARLAGVRLQPQEVMSTTDFPMLLRAVQRFPALLPPTTMMDSSLVCAWETEGKVALREVDGEGSRSNL
jgi:hypothetical protein